MPGSSKKAFRLTVFSLISALVFLEGGCGKSEPGGQPVTTQEKAANDPIATSNEPVTLKILFRTGSVDFEKHINQWVKKKYPNYTLEEVKGKIEDLIASGQTPDIVVDSYHTRIPDYFKLNMQYDLSDLIKKYNFDLNRLDSSMTADIKAYGDKGQMYALPISRAIYLTLYNKDLFDKFSVPYPKDRMTWDQAVELAKALTRYQDGVQYRGLDIDEVRRSFSELSPRYVDPVTDQAIVTNDKFVKFAQLFKDIYSIPGNGLSKDPKSDFIKDKRLAMYLYSTDLMFTADSAGLNWDVVTFPTFKEAPNLGPNTPGPILLISAVSKYKDQAFQAISYLFSDEVQTENAKDGKMTVLNNPDVQQAFMANQPQLKSKNLQAAALTLKAASIPDMISKYEGTAQAQIMDTFKDIAEGSKDINTSLRDYEDRVNQAIEAEKGK